MKIIFRKFRLPEDEILTLPFLSEVPFCVRLCHSERSEESRVHKVSVYVENQSGNRFPIDTYGYRWLAFYDNMK